MILYNCSKGIAGKEIEMENEEMNLAELLKDTAEGKSNKKNLSNLGRKQRLARGKGKSKSPT